MYPLAGDDCRLTHSNPGCANSGGCGARWLLSGSYCFALRNHFPLQFRGAICTRTFEFSSVDFSFFSSFSVESGQELSVPRTLRFWKKRRNAEIFIPRPKNCCDFLRFYLRFSGDVSAISVAKLASLHFAIWERSDCSVIAIFGGALRSGFSSNSGEIASILDGESCETPVISQRLAVILIVGLIWHDPALSFRATFRQALSVLNS